MAHLLNNNNDNARQVLNPVGPVPAAGNRNFVAERNHEMRQDHAAANDRFKVRKRAVNLPHKPANADIENSIFSTAANYPPIRAVYPSLSYFIPNFKSTLYYVNVMDCLMASTKSWTDDCLGWVPPYSQIYISVLLYIQVMRAMEAAGALRPNSDLSVLLRELRDTFPLENLMIPGPLVCLFQNLTSFWPFASGRFGNVTPFLPNSPGWSQERQFCFSDTICSVLPNISLFFSRLHSTLSLVEYDDLTEEEFRNHVQGPSHLGFLFERPCDANEFEMSNMCSPGADLSYPGSLRLWREAHQQLNNFDIPEDFNVDETVVNDNWTAALRFDENMQWFSPIVNMMDKYCRFFHGSVALSECTPDGSAAGSIICTAYPDSTLLMPPQWYEDAGGRTSRTHGDPNCIGHYTLRSIPTLEFTASTCIEDIPDANVLAALTYQFNLQRLGFADADALQGRFWKVIPNTYEKTHIDVFQGVIATIAREFHSNVQL